MNARDALSRVQPREITVLRNYKPPYDHRTYTATYNAYLSYAKNERYHLTLCEGRKIPVTGCPYVVLYTTCINGCELEDRLKIVGKGHLGFTKILNLWDGWENVTPMRREIRLSDESIVVFFELPDQVEGEGA